MKNLAIASCIVGSLALAAMAQVQPQGRGEGQGRETGRNQRVEGIGQQRNGSGGEAHQGQEEILLRAVMQNPELAAKVGLKEEQIKAIREAGFAQREQMVTLRGQSELARMQVEKLLAADPVDESAVMKAVDAAGLQEVAAKKAEIAFRLKMKNLVGEDVIRKMREEMKTQMAERRAAFQQGGQDRPGGPGGEMRPPRRESVEGAPKAPWMQKEMKGPKPAPES